MDRMRLLPHAWFGVALLALSEGAMLARVEPFWTWHTPFAWTGYILLLDGIVHKWRGSSWLTTNRREFAFLAVVSVPLWVVFEGYNLFIENWYYINLPENLFARYFGYAWAFATISPGIFQTAELVSVVRNPRLRTARFHLRASRYGGPVGAAGSRLPIRDCGHATGDSRLATVDYV